MTTTPTSNPESTAENQAAQAASRLLFPHYSQLDPSWGFEVGTERTMCGLVSVKSVIDHYNGKSGLETPDIKTLLDIVIGANDAKVNGMSHAVEVELLKAQGLVAWRRNWEAPASDPQWFVDNEQYTPEQVAAVTSQQFEELIVDSVPERELLSITASLDEQNPVIVSVKPGFGGNRADHQIVLVGKETSKHGDSFVIMDPEHAPGSTLHTEPVERFFEYFNNRAIFVKQ